ECGDEAAVGGVALVPPAEQAGEGGGDEDFVDGGVEADPGEAGGEGAGVVGEEGGIVGVVEPAGEVGEAEVAEVDDGGDGEGRERGKGFVGEGPVVLVCGEVA